MINPTNGQLQIVQIFIEDPETGVTYKTEDIRQMFNPDIS